MSYTIIRPADHAAWLRAREEGIGSSEVTILMGVNHYAKNDRFHLYRRKKGLEPGIPETDKPWVDQEPLWMGHLMEASVAEGFAQKTGAWIDPESEGDWIAVRDDKPYMRVSPDRIYVPAGKEHSRENWCICECKTSSVLIDPDNIPAYWTCQLQYQMGVMGIKHGAVAWITGYPKLHHGYREFDFNPEMYALIEQAIDEFWNENILAGVCPDPEHIEDMREFFRKEKATFKGKALTADDDLTHTFSRLCQIHEEMRDLETEEKNLSETMEKAIMGYEGITDGEGSLIASRVPPAKKKKLDLERLMEEQPGIYDDYSIPTPVFDEDRFKKENKELWKEYQMTPPPGDPKFKIIYPAKISDRAQVTVF